MTKDCSPSYKPGRKLTPFTFIYLFIFAVPGIEPRGVLPLCYTPGPIFILYFETGSHQVAEGLTKERERKRQGERERERERDRERERARERES